MKNIALSANYGGRYCSIALLVLHRCGMILEVSLTWERITGFKRHECVGRSIAQFFPDSYRSAIDLEQSLSAGDLVHVDMPIARRDGSVLWLEYEASHRNANELSGYLIDKTSQKYLENMTAVVSSAADRIENSVFEAQRMATKLRMLKTDSDSREAIEFILNSLNKVSDVKNDLLGCIQPGKRPDLRQRMDIERGIYGI